MNYKMTHNCPICFKEFPGTTDGEIAARLHCAPQAKTVFRCGKCGRPFNDPSQAEDCCQVRDEVVILNDIRKSRKITLPCIDIDDL